MRDVYLMTEAVSWEEAEWPPTRCNVEGEASCEKKVVWARKAGHDVLARRKSGVFLCARQVL